MANLLNSFTDLTPREKDFAHTLLNIVANSIERGETATEQANCTNEGICESLRTAMGPDPRGPG